MPQAIGAAAYISYCEESAWGVTPESPTMKRLTAATYGESLGANTEELVSNAINAGRAVEAVRGGNIAAGGAVPFELALLGLGTILKHALGSATSGRDATASAAPIAGVTVRYAHSACPTGAGTLAFTAAGTTLQWTPQGGTPGAAVDVSEGGDFALEGGAASQALYVRVDAASLPVADDTDTITVSATLYKHIIKRGILPAGLTIEKGFPDIGKYLVYPGVKIGALSMAVANSGFVTGSLDLLAKAMNAPAAISLGTPAAATHSPIVHHEATIEEGGAAATILGLNLSLTNNIKEDDYVVGSRYRASLGEGKGDATGSATFLFDGVAIMNKWLQETESSLRATFTQAGGSLEFYYPRIRYFGDGAAKIETAQGIVLPLNFRAIKDATEGSDLVVTLINTEATI